MTDFVYDTGALIAAENSSARMREVHIWAMAMGGTRWVPGPVLAQAWRGGPRCVRVARLMADCRVVEGYPQAVYRRAGRLLAAVSLPPEKRPDAVDALVAITAAEYEAAAIVTSDPEDLTAYVAALGIKPEIVRV